MTVNTLLRALSDDKRREIIMCLSKKRLTTGELASSLSVSPSALSYHISQLKRADLLQEVKLKNYIYYELNLSVLEQLTLWIDSIKEANNFEK
ncbi:DNA-binding transcriptional ArsR family regulator [Enterococcus sp. PF1-24]|uniref:metalloregulator ArsR/SmtB family transcription factor n=1 Tax=unclassified Enterococcus TaxID=2608891 RepID=UPI0024731084|nr:MULTISPECIES: metalloregulator ArsR/SmtB family transcription factor [unclassified Enterococcus]MDH6363473.1 DNA-binding transcriptional ArsR family regulator [Enterococcus sp. PFB1-1]MDH6400567.1 DNA-binding transcriptional ArsR family regulator [Enterococcus sp. PF1-24]